MEGDYTLLGEAEAHNCVNVVLSYAIKALRKRGMSLLDVAMEVKTIDKQRKLYNICLQQCVRIFKQYAVEHGPSHSKLPAANKEAFAKALADAGDLAVQEYLGAKLKY